MIVLALSILIVIMNVRGTNSNYINIALANAVEQLNIANGSLRRFFFIGLIRNYKHFKFTSPAP